MDVAQEAKKFADKTITSVGVYLMDIKLGKPLVRGEEKSMLK